MKYVKYVFSLVVLFQHLTSSDSKKRIRMSQFLTLDLSSIVQVSVPDNSPSSALRARSREFSTLETAIFFLRSEQLSDFENLCKKIEAFRILHEKELKKNHLLGDGDYVARVDHNLFNQRIIVELHKKAREFNWPADKIPKMVEELQSENGEFLGAFTLKKDTSFDTGA